MSNNLLIPVWPQALNDVDVVKVCFALDFVSSCVLQPADFLSLGRVLRVSGRPLLNTQDHSAVQQWEALFQPALSQDPVARNRFQKPAPAFVINIPITEKKRFESGDRLELEVLFVGTGIPSIHVFLRSLIHLGNLGLVAGEGRYEVIAALTRQVDGSLVPAWRQGEPLEPLEFIVLNLAWLILQEQIGEQVVVEFNTPARLVVSGKPLRKPSFQQIFPFMLRRVTSMLFSHAGVELLDDPAGLIAQSQEVEVVDAKFTWQDWRSLSGQNRMSVGGFTGQSILAGGSLEEIYWVIAASSMFGIGKNAAYGGGHLTVKP
jgi:hypothetical protein